MPGAARSAVVPLRREARPGSDPQGALRLRAATGILRGNTCDAAARQSEREGARAAPPVTAPADARRAGLCMIVADGGRNRPRRRDHPKLLFENAPHNAEHQLQANT